MIWPAVRSALLALALSCAAIWQLGCDGSVMGIKIGPHNCGLQTVVWARL